jgi:hypothetical protein
METVNRNFISKAEAARRLGGSRVLIYDAIAAGKITVDERGRILRAPFEATLAALANITLPTDESAA